MDPAYSNSLRSAEGTLGNGEQSGRFQGNHDYAGESSTCTGTAGFHSAHQGYIFRSLPFRQFLEDEVIDTIHSPPRSCDLNTIKHI